MQQIGTGSRFWWRALDAPATQPVTSKSALHSDYHPFYLRTMPAPIRNFTLRVPRGDRRRSQRKAPRASGVAIAFAGILAVAGMATMAAFIVPGASLHMVRDTAGHYVTKALIGAGFGIDQVSLTGQRYTLDGEVFDALDLANVRTFSALDTAAALKRIERISWVDTAQITRVFPGMLHVAIQERTPAAIWRRGDRSYLIDATGRTLGPVQQSNGWVLPHVAGEGASGEASLLLAALARHPEIQGRFDYAERIADRRWSIVLNNGSRIELSADREVEGLEHVATNQTLRKALFGPPVTIDVRPTGRAVIRTRTTPTTSIAPHNSAGAAVQQP